MPGSVSDSYDPEFSTGANASAVEDAVKGMVQRVTDVIGSDQLQDIVQVVRGESGKRFATTFTEREWRIIRFAMNRALESL